MACCQILLPPMRLPHIPSQGQSACMAGPFSSAAAEMQRPLLEQGMLRVESEALFEDAVSLDEEQDTG